MANPQLLDYIKQQMANGASQADLRKVLLDKGWNPNDVDSAFKSVEQPVSSDSVLSSVSKSNNLNRFLPLIFIAVLGIFLIGGIVWSYFYFFQSPDKIVGMMMKNMSEVKAGEYNIIVTGQITGDNAIPFESAILEDSGSETQSFILTFSGASDMRDLNNLKAKGLVSAQLPDSNIKFTFESMALGDVNYVKFTDIPEIPLFDVADFTSALINTWIKVDPNEIAEQMGMSQEQLQENINESNQLTEEQIQQIGELVYSKELLKVKDNLGTDKIDGVSTYHYLVTINKEVVPEIIIEASQILGEGLSEDKIEEMKEDIAGFDFPEAEIWIGKQDKYLYKVKMDLDYEDLDNQSFVLDLSVVMTMTSHNKEVNIEAPTDFKSIQEIMQTIMEQMMGSSIMGTSTPSMLPGSTIDVELDTDGDGLTDVLEAYYGTDINNPDTDDDGYTDGQEVTNGYNPAGEGKLDEMSF